MIRWGLCSFTLVLWGCTSSAPLAFGDAGAETLDALPADTGLSDAGPGLPPTLYFHVVTNKATFAHRDGLSGQTARGAKQGLRSLRLYRDAADPKPFSVFDHGKGFVEAGYNPGDDTVVGTAPVASLAEGRYMIARVVVTHSKFTVSSSLHYLGSVFPGDYDCVQVLSDAVTLEGVVRNRGFYRYTFNTAGRSFPQEGTSAPLPTSPETGGFTLKTDGVESYYEWPIDLVVSKSIIKDLKVVVELNMFESFRWEDQAEPTYEKGIFDTTPLGFEPIRRFGANTFSFRLE